MEADPLTSRNRDAAYVAALSGMMGLFLGIASGWQVAVESAQVIAGIVHYPTDNPFAMYHWKTWTLLHQVPAVFLAMGVPERVVAMAIAGLTGVVSFQAIALTAHVAGARRLLAAFFPLMLWGSRVYVDIGSVYPVRILSDAPWVLYGCLGTMLVLLIWSLFGAGFLRWPAFLLGLFPAIHPTLGAWCLLIGALAYVWNWRGARAAIARAVPWLCGGLAITAASLAVHVWLVRGLPDISYAEKSQYVAAFAANWDSHRRPFPLDHAVLVMAGLSIILCGGCLRFLAGRFAPWAQFFLRALFLSAIASIVLCVSTQWQERLPTVLLMAMPGRFINIVGLAMPALCLGLLDRHRISLAARGLSCGLMLYLLLCAQRLELGLLYVPMSCTMFLAAGLVVLACWPAEKLFRYCGLFGLAALAIQAGLEESLEGGLVWCVLAFVIVAQRLPNQRTAVVASAIDWLQALCVLGMSLLMLDFVFVGSLAILLVSVFARQHAKGIQRLLPKFALPAISGVAALALILAFVRQSCEAYPQLADWRNHPVYSRAFGRQGMLLTASTIRATQLRTRRPVLLEGPALNQIPYVPESGPSMNHILQRVYGEDLLAAKPKGSPRGGGLQRDAGKELWEGRDAGQWRALADEFGFTQIVTYDDWNLKLPVVARSKHLVLYEVPPAASSATRLNVAAHRADPASENSDE